MTNEESRERTRLAVKVVLADLRLAMYLGGLHGPTLQLASNLNVLLHAPEGTRGQESLEPVQRYRVGP